MAVDGVLPLRIYEKDSEGLRSVNTGNNNADQSLNLNTVNTLDINTAKFLHLNDLDASQETPKLRPKRSVPVPTFYFEDDADEDEKPGGSKKVKKEAVGVGRGIGTSRRNDYDLPTPNENTCKMSSDMRDCCKTMCKICDKPYGLTRMRTHTLGKHKLQITKYKEIHGPFVIIDVVYHKCQLCGKLILLDSDFLGAHIKNTHKMKEREYSDQYLIKVVNFKDNNTKSEKISKISDEHQEFGPSPDNEIFNDNGKKNDLEAIDKKLKSTKPKKKLKKNSKVNKMLNFEFDFNTLEYDCNLKDCEMCGRSIAVDLNQSKVFVDEEVTNYLDMVETRDSSKELNPAEDDNCAAEDDNGPAEDGNDPAKDDNVSAKNGNQVTNMNEDISSLSEMQVDDIGVDGDASNFSDEEMELDEDFDTSKEDFSNSDSNEASGQNEDSVTEDEHQEFGARPNNDISFKSDNDKKNDLEAVVNVNKNSTEEEITLDSDDFDFSSASDSELVAREFKMTQKETGSLKFTITSVTNTNR